MADILSSLLLLNVCLFFSQRNCSASPWQQKDCLLPYSVQQKAGKLRMSCLKVCLLAKGPIRPEFILVSAAWSDLEYFLFPLNGVLQLVHRKATPSMKFSGTQLRTRVERCTVTVKCLLAQEHNSMSPARARSRTYQLKIVWKTHRCWKSYDANYSPDFCFVYFYFIFVFRGLCWRWLVTVSRTFSLAVIIFL